MAAVSDLHIDLYDLIFAKGAHVCLRCSAAGGHCGEPPNRIQPLRNKAKWHAAVMFEVRDGEMKGWVEGV
jgi:hypothetical protein